jgi:hypothetical protein
VGVSYGIVGNHAVVGNWAGCLFPQMNLGVIHRVALRAENTVNHATSEKNYIPFFHNRSKSEERIRKSDLTKKL